MNTKEPKVGDFQKEVGHGFEFCLEDDPRCCAQIISIEHVEADKSNPENVSYIKIEQKILHPERSRVMTQQHNDWVERTGKGEKIEYQEEVS